MMIGVKNRIQQDEMKEEGWRKKYKGRGMKDEGRHHKRTSFLNHFLSILPEARNLRPSPRCVRSLWEKLKISLHSVDGLGQILRRRNLCFFGKLRHCNANLSITYTFFIRTSKFDLRLNVVILKPFWGSKCSKHVLIFYLYKIVYVYNNKGANVTNDLNLLENMKKKKLHQCNVDKTIEYQTSASLITTTP